MVFSVLCLTIFAVLSFVTTNYERKLSEKTAAAVLNFYEADSHAEEILAEMQKMLNANTEPGLIDEFSAQFEHEDFLVSPLEINEFFISFKFLLMKKQVLHFSHC